MKPAVFWAIDGSRRKARANVGQWADRDQSDLAGVGENAFDDEIDGVGLSLWRVHGRGDSLQRTSLGEPGALVGSSAIDRLERAAKDRDVLASHQGEKMPGVGVAVLCWNVALNDRQTFNRDLWRVERQEDGEAVLRVAAEGSHRRVGVDDDPHFFPTLRCAVYSSGCEMQLVSGACSGSCKNRNAIPNEQLLNPAAP